MIIYIVDHDTNGNVAIKLVKYNRFCSLFASSYVVFNKNNNRPLNKIQRVFNERNVNRNRDASLDEDGKRLIFLHRNIK